MPTMDFETYVRTDLPPEERAAALAAILENEDAAGIEYAVVMPNPHSRPMDNRALSETCRGQRRAILCCQVNPNDGAEAIAGLERSVVEYGARMLKLMPAIFHVSPTGPVATELVRKARELGIVVNIHSGSEISHPHPIGVLARRFPEVPIIMDHMGYREWGGEAIEAARDNPNLYLGTTIASFEPSFVARAIRELGPERVIYGSNLPDLYSDLAVESLRRANFGREVEELLFGGNLARILGATSF